jgi:flagellar FliJ protein
MYRFNLQVLLDYRKRIEEGLQIELSQIRRDLEKEKQLLISSQRKKLHYEEELVKKEEKDINVNEALLYRDYLKGMRIRIKEQRDLVAKVKMDLDKKREELLDATKKKKVLEKVKEGDWKRFMEGLQKRERLLIDEVGIRKYQRSK